MMRAVDQTQYGDQKGNCFAACVASLTGLPLDTLTERIDMGRAEDPTEHWWTRAVRVVADMGWCLAYHEDRVPVGYTIMSGMAERGLLHSVVAYDGRMVHDPHYSRAGLLDGDRDFITATPRVMPASGAPLTLSTNGTEQ